MSYDISLRNGDLEFEIGNYTYNCAPMFYAGAGKSLNELNGMKAKDAYLILFKGFQYMRDNPEEMKKMNPKNGWGNYDSFLDYVGRITIACKNNPEAILEVC